MIDHYHRPRTVREALALKRRFRGRAAFLAGGTYVNSSESPLHPEHFISLEGLGLDRIEAKRGLLVVGALCTLQQLIEDRRVPRALKAAASQVVSRNVRNAATLGGHVASKLPHSDVIPMLVALDAQVALAGAGAAKAIPVMDYIRAGRPDLITKIILSRPGANRVAACRNVRASANARSILSAAVSMTVVRDQVRDPIIALGGVSGHVMRLASVEKELNGKPLPGADEIQALVSAAVRPAATLAGSAAFRKCQAGVVVALALREALRQKGGRG
jgi:putative selenate reductase FAD-binding subunit